MTDEYTGEEQRRSNGRRKSDQYQCAMHDYLQNKNDHCFDVIKQTIRDEVTQRDHKFEILESRLENYISKWSVGIIVLICTSLLGGMFGMAMWQIDIMHKELKSVSEALLEVSRQVSLVTTKQQGMLDRLEKWAPEHQELMKHMRDNR